jgi:hypothetical protein
MLHGVAPTYFLFGHSVSKGVLCPAPLGALLQKIDIPYLKGAFASANRFYPPREDFREGEINIKKRKSKRRKMTKNRPRDRINNSFPLLQSY